MVGTVRTGEPASAGSPSSSDGEPGRPRTQGPRSSEGDKSASTGEKSDNDPIEWENLIWDKGG